MAVIQNLSTAVRMSIKNGFEFKYPNDWFIDESAFWSLTVYLKDSYNDLSQQPVISTPIEIHYNEVMTTMTNEKFIYKKTLMIVSLVGQFEPEKAQDQFIKTTLIKLNNKLLAVTLINKQFGINLQSNPLQVSVSRAKSM